MAQPDQLKTPIIFERFVEVENKVAVDAKDVADTLIPQLVEEKCLELHR